MKRQIRYAQFQPSTYSYGAEEAASAETESSDQTAKDVTAWIPAVKKLLGVDDPRQTVALLQNRLRDLEHGTAAERVSAMLAANALTVKGAIEKTKVKLAEAEAAARQARARDKLYTGLAITGVATGGMLALFLATKAYKTYRETDE